VVYEWQNAGEVWANSWANFARSVGVMRGIVEVCPLNARPIPLGTLVIIKIFAFMMSEGQW
jgi:hypothetical protein